MNINLLPWREKKQQQNSKLLLRYGFIFMVFVFFIFMIIRHFLFLELQDVKKQKSILSGRFLVDQSGMSRRAKTKWIVSFVSSLPLAVQDGIYINKILIYENLITLGVSVSEIRRLENFIQIIKNQRGIEKINIDGGEVYSGAGYENKDNKFIITLYLESAEKISR